MKEAFTMMDQDSDGLITAQDLTSLLSSLGGLQSVAGLVTNSVKFKSGKPASPSQINEFMRDAFTSPSGVTGLNFTQFLTKM